MSSNEDELRDLLARIAEGDTDSLRRLYEATAPRLLAIANRMLGGRRDLAEDALQEAFVAIWQSAARFDPARGSVGAWLATIVRRKAIDRLRASPWLSREAEEQPEQAAEQRDDELAMSLRACLEQLDEKQSRAIRLAYLYGLTHMELSRTMAAPLGTVKSWLRRGLLALKRCLDG